MKSNRMKFKNTPPESLSVKDLTTALQQRDEEIKERLQKCQSDIDNFGSISSENKKALTELTETGVKMQDQLLALEQKLSKRSEGGPTKVKTWGQTVVDDPSFKSLTDRTMSRTGRIPVKSLTSGNAGFLVTPDRLSGIIAPPAKEFVRDLIMSGATVSNAVEYVRETVFINNATTVGDGNLKPGSLIEFEPVVAGVKTIAHWTAASKQILDDAPQLASYIDARMRYGLQDAEDQQLLLGDGTGTNILGLIPQASAYDESKNKEGDSIIDIIRHALLQVRLSLYTASGIILNPVEWETIELQKDTAGRYIWSNPTLNNGKNLWGVPVVETTSMPQGHFLAGAFSMGCQIYDREASTVEVSTDDRDNFIRNMVTIRAEERLAFAVYRPQAFVHGRF